MNVDDLLKPEYLELDRIKNDAVLSFNQSITSTGGSVDGVIIFMDLFGEHIQSLSESLTDSINNFIKENDFTEADAEYGGEKLREYCIKIIGDFIDEVK